MWSHADGLRPCNDCRRVLAAGAECWRGEFTPSIWCPPCAEAAGLDGGPRVKKIDPMTALAASLEQLRAKVQPRPVRAWQEREGE